MLLVGYHGWSGRSWLDWRHIYLAQVIAGQRLPPRLSDPRPRDLDPLVARHHALYLRTYEPCAHQLDQQISRKTIREQKGFGTAVGGRQQLEHAATTAAGLGAAPIRYLVR
jgi:hypothetical protein